MREEPVSGKIFDIRRFSTHDGAGIRTTVFFKGCPLKCVWCQNPEGISPERRPIYFEKKCIGCGNCLSISKGRAVRKEEGSGRILLDREKEDNWQEIIDGCPSGAMAMDSEVWKAEKLVEELRKDEVFFRRQGGVTLSGGEPLLQGKFAVRLLKLLQDRGIHTAIETALHVPEETVKEALPLLDLVYADMKLAEEERHREYVGVSNRLIKENLKLILTSPYRDRVIIRTPLIPDYTAYEENIEEISRFLSGIYPEVRYELLNYNPLAEAKYHLVNRSYCFEENPQRYTGEQMQEFGRIAKENGIKNLILELP